MRIISQDVTSRPQFTFCLMLYL